MKEAIEKISEVLIDLSNYKSTADETIADIIENFNPKISKEETSAIKKVAKAMADDKLDKLNNNTQMLAEMMESIA